MLKLLQHAYPNANLRIFLKIITIRMYADGSIAPISAYKGVKLSRSQINDYMSGKTNTYRRSQGNPSTVYIKFYPAQMAPTVYSSNPDAPHQSKTVPSQRVGITLSTPSFRGSIQDDQGFVGGGGITWPEYRALHMDLPVQVALRRFRAIKRGQNPNTMTGGMHM